MSLNAREETPDTLFLLQDKGAKNLTLKIFDSGAFP